MIFNPVISSSEAEIITGQISVENGEGVQIPQDVSGKHWILRPTAPTVISGLITDRTSFIIAFWGFDTQGCMAYVMNDEDSAGSAEYGVSGPGDYGIYGEVSVSVQNGQTYISTPFVFPHEKYISGSYTYEIY